MRPRSAAVIACRVIAIWLGVQAVTQTIAFLIFTRGGIEASGEFWAIVGTRAIIAWSLWIFAGTLAGSMTRDLPDEVASSTRPTVNVHAVAISIAGIVVTVTAIPSLVALAVLEAGSAGSFTEIPTPGGFFGFGDRGAAAAAEATRLAIGLVLVGMSGDIARSLARKYPEPEQPPARNDAP